MWQGPGAHAVSSGVRDTPHGFNSYLDLLLGLSELISLPDGVCTVASAHFAYSVDFLFACLCLIIYFNRLRGKVILVFKAL